MLHRAQMSDFKHLPWVFRNSNRDRRCYARIREISLSSVSDTSKIKCSVLRLITILDPLEVDDKILVSSWRDLFVRMKFCEENFKTFGKIGMKSFESPIRESNFIVLTVFIRWRNIFFTDSKLAIFLSSLTPENQTDLSLAKHSWLEIGSKIRAPMASKRIQGSVG